MSRRLGHLQKINRVTLWGGTVLLLVLIISQAIYLYQSYLNDIEERESRKVEQLRGIVTSTATSFDAVSYIVLISRYETPGELQDKDQDELYLNLYNQLNEIKSELDLQSELYTIITTKSDDGTQESRLGVTTEYTPRWLENYPVDASQLALVAFDDEKKFERTIDGQPYITVLAPIRQGDKELGYLAIDQDRSEIVTAANEDFKLLLRYNLLATLLLMVAIALFYWRVRRLTRLELIKGNHASQRLSDTFRIIEEFVEKVKQGDYSSELQLDNYKDDNLAQALNVLHKKLADNAQNASNRNWIAEGRIRIASVLRLHNDFESLSVEVTQAITTYVDAVQGALYVVEGEGKDLRLQMKARHAYNRRKFQMESFKIGEGLVGQCAFEKAMIYRTEIPADYLSIRSGLMGEARPSALLLMPLITDDTLHGVLELASVKPFTKLQISFVEELSDIIARTIFNLKTNSRTVELLHESQEQSKVLEQQQEELQENARAMQATQEELKHTNRRLEEQIEEVNLSQRKLHSLLENSSEIITIYDEDKTVTYESPSVQNILGFKPQELVGESDFDRVHEDGREKLEHMFDQVQKHPNEKPVIEFSYQKKDGSWIWLEATGKNLINDPAVGGIVVNSRDITERRIAEREQIMRGKMQALSENSQDIIIRFDLEGNILYTNPMIETYTGIPKEHFTGKHLERMGIHPNIIEGYLGVIGKTQESEDLVSVEMDFPTKDGLRVMRVNSIPEADADNKLETLLVVSSDITEQKEQENIIREANKKITDSINYAKRIQNSIIPDNEIIQQFFPNSFIFYRPKDVVSGDFPWFYQKGDDIYFAAVDCTGHGVPGAMMSLIGYFLLNEITGHPESYDPATILTMLDQMVRKTLRQDQEGAQARDGMDVALTRINLKTKVVEYAGAHRPLYLVRDGELTQYKGARRAIGGTHSKVKHEFETHRIEFQAEDAIYFFSDGLPDQFGGPEGAKYSPRRIRELAVEGHNLPQQALRERYEEDFLQWMSGRKQIDDVLLIGIKF